MLYGLHADVAYSTSGRTIDRYACSLTDLSQGLSVLLSRPSLLLALLQIFVQWLDQRESRRYASDSQVVVLVGWRQGFRAERIDKLAWVLFGFLFVIDSSLHFVALKLICQVVAQDSTDVV